MKIIIRSVRNFQLFDDKVSEDIVREEKFSKVFLTAYFYHHDLECKKKKKFGKLMIAIAVEQR